MTDEIPEPPRSAWEGLPEPLAKGLVQLRQLILETASENPAIGPLEETLKWGEPAFLTSATGSGTTLRINRHKKSPVTYALYVHCQTDLVDRYEQIYGDELTFDGNRAVLFDSNDELPVDAIKHCVAMALTYHLRTHR